MVDRGCFQQQKNLWFVDERVLAHASENNPRQMPSSFVPGALDVICSMGPNSFHHVGNRMFRQFISANLDRYEQSLNKIEKTAVINSVVDIIRERGGSFVRHEITTNRWHDVGDKLAREKVGHAIRTSLRKKNPPKKSKAQECKSQNTKARMTPLSVLSQMKTKDDNQKPSTSTKISNSACLNLPIHIEDFRTGVCSRLILSSGPSPMDIRLTRANTAPISFGPSDVEVPKLKLRECVSLNKLLDNEKTAKKEYDPLMAMANSLPPCESEYLSMADNLQSKQGADHGVSGLSLERLLASEEEAELDFDPLLTTTMPPSLLRFESGCSMMSNISFIGKEW